MMQAGLRIVFVAASLAMSLGHVAVAGDEGTSVEVERPAAAPAEPDPSYRPPWADPFAKAPEPGIANDPTPFDPSDVDTNSDTLNNNLNNMDQ